MRLNSYCLCCHINKQEEQIRNFSDEEKKLTYMRHIFRRLSQPEEDDCSPSLAAEFEKYFSSFWNVQPKDYTDIKKEFNLLMMDLEEKLRISIRSQEDPLRKALVYARTGNYIDFAALSHVKKEEMLSLMDEAGSDTLDAAEYEQFCKELKSAHSLVYLTDNCGEIVLDKLVVEFLMEKFPHLNITVIVRGLPFANDATMEDAQMCGLTNLVSVIGNGSDVGGTWLPHISSESRSIIENADVILAKGQGNFETLHGCHLNIYYLFLCKCLWFMRMFHAEKFQGMFVNENRIPTEE